MLEIHYVAAGNQELVKTYEKASDFIAKQYLEVPDLQDDYKVTKVSLDGKDLELPEKTIGGLFNVLNQK